MATLGEMAAGVAHEINQPLNAIRIGSEYFQKMAGRGGSLPSEMLAKVSGEIASQVERAANIISHLREFGRKSELDELEKLDINKPIRDIFTLLGQQLKLRQINVNLELEENLPPVLGVCNRLEQVFINLVMNARDSMEEERAGGYGEDKESSLTIRSYHKDGKVVVVMSDTGAGMAESVKDRIFEPFFTTKEVGKGTGLGLSISYGIVKDYGGDIEVESEAGVGTTFKLTFPTASSSKEPLEEGLA
jgi:C4-dicarboxylate-specific signal transduction histidine kinase